MLTRNQRKRLAINSTNINAKLPADALIQILARLPLANLIRHVSLVCRQWHGLVPTVCRTKRRLLICSRELLPNENRPFCGNRRHQTNDHNRKFDCWSFVARRPIPGYNKLLARHHLLVLSYRLKPEQLVTLFPNIRRLAIWQWDLIAETVCQLVGGWSNLAELRVIIHGYDIRSIYRNVVQDAQYGDYRRARRAESRTRFWRELLTTIGGRHSGTLRHLAVHDWESQLLEESQDRSGFHLPSYMPRLESLSTGLYHSLDHVRHLYTCYPRLRQLALTHPRTLSGVWLDTELRHTVKALDSDEFRQLSHFISYIPIECHYQADKAQPLAAHLYSPLATSLVYLELATSWPWAEFLIRSGCHRLPQLSRLKLHRDLRFESLRQNMIGWHNELHQLPPTPTDQETAIVYPFLKYLQAPSLPHPVWFLGAENKAQKQARIQAWSGWAREALPRLEQVSIYLGDAGDEYCYQCRDMQQLIGVIFGDQCTDKKAMALDFFRQLPSMKSANYKWPEFGYPVHRAPFY